jgi:ubiquinone/menaquinone biosynthesis C-methylase UbiE
VIHRVASEGFSRSAAAYERGRPGYPDAAVACVASRLPPRARVLDLAAGTGKLTRPLLGAGLDVVAVEPVAEMRAVLPAAARPVAGTAEAIPLDDAAVHAVTVGQAFHWFDREAALTEIHRVLKPDGLLALLWNRRIEEEPVNAAIEQLLEPYRAGTPTHRWDSWRGALEGTRLFGSLDEHEFANEQRLDAAGMEARVGSISFIATLDAAERERVLERARALAGEGTVVVPYRTEVQLCRRI